jgi:hypothetical protein
MEGVFGEGNKMEGLFIIFQDIKQSGVPSAVFA